MQPEFTAKFIISILRAPIPVAALSNAWVWGRSLAGTAGSNSIEGMYICLFWISCVVQVEILPTSQTLVQGSSTDFVVSLSVIKSKNNSLHLQWVRGKGRAKNLWTGCGLLEKIFSCSCAVYSCLPIHTDRIFWWTYPINALKTKRICFI
jgi:hypothetical protein